MTAVANRSTREAARDASFASCGAVYDNTATGPRPLTTSERPLDGTQLRKANSLCLSAIENATDLPTPAERYISRLTQATEVMSSKITTLWTELSKQKELFKTRKRRTTGKRVALDRKFVFGTQEVLGIAREAEKATVEKPSRKLLYVANVQLA
jgi:hypothetical protein